MSNFYYKRSLSEEALTKLNKSRNIDVSTTATGNTSATAAGNTGSSPHTANSPNDRTNESPKDQQQRQGQTLHASPKMINLRSSRIPHVNTNK